MKTVRKLFLAGGILALLAYVGGRIHRKVSFRPAPSIRQTQAEEGVPVEVVRIEPASFATFISATGRVVSEEEASVSAKYGGRILSFPKEIGDTVAKGETLATLDTLQLEIQREQALSQVAVAQRTAAQAKAEMDDAAKDVGRMERLFAEKVISEKEVERARLRYDSAVQRHEAAQAQVKAAQDAVRLVEQAIEESVITAPFSGIIGSKLASVGEVVPAGRPILTLANLAKLTCAVNLPENDLPRVRPGQDATVVFDAFPGKEFTASVLRIAGTPNPDTRLFEAHLRLRERPAGLRPGLFVKATIVTRRSAGVLAVPEQALVSQEGTTAVFTVKEGKARLTPVAIGEKSDGKVEIRSGLASGEFVVISGREMLTEGISVRVRKAENGL